MNRCCCCCLVTKSCSNLHYPIDCSTLGFSVPYHLPEFAQIHVHCIDYAIQPSNPLLSSSPSALQSSQHQGFFPMNWLITSGDQNIGASTPAPILPMNFQGWCPLGLTGLIFLLFKELSRVFSRNTVQKHQFFSIQSSLWSSSHIRTWLLGRT